MLRKIFGKEEPHGHRFIKSKESISKAIPRRTGQQVAKHCQQIIRQNEMFAQSNFYTTYLPTMLDSIVLVLDEKVDALENYFDNSLIYEMQLASISLSISEEEGLLHMFVRLWIGFCSFQLSNIVASQEPQEEKSTKIKSSFHRQFFLLCYFIYLLCQFLYERPFSSCDFDNHDLFIFIRNQLTCSPKWASVQNIILKNVNCTKHEFSQEQVEQNMADLQKLCKISSTPIPFIESTNLMKQFYREHQIEAKILKAIRFIESIREEISNYRQFYEMNENYLICADDTFSVATYVMWKVDKNIYGACSYVEAILCCEYEEMSHSNMMLELNRLHNQAHHSFDTIHSVSRIKQPDISTMVEL